MTYLDFINNFRNELSNGLKKFIILHAEFKNYKKFVFISGDSIRITKNNLLVSIDGKQNIINFDDICYCEFVPAMNNFIILQSYKEDYKLRLK